jgi:hypothetical protein
MGCFQSEDAIERAVLGQLLRWYKIDLHIILDAIVPKKRLDKAL